MEFVKLGRSDLRVSRIGLGAWQFGGDAWGPLDYENAKAIVERAFDSGINFFDTAQIYGRGRSEEFLGSAIKELGIRDEVVIATKVPGFRLGYHDVLKSTERSLERLKVEAIDLYQVHWPSISYNVPIEETMRAMERLVEKGLVRYIGLSNFPACLVEQARQSLSKADIVSNQVRYNLIERDVEKELWPYLRKEGIALIAWSPIAKGALTGKYAPDSPPKFEDVRADDEIFHPENLRRIWKVVEVLREVGEKYGKTPAQVALNWLLYDPLIVPIPGARRPEQAESNAGAAGWRLRKEDWRRIDRVSREVRIDRALW